jgi:hypothetical protein
MSYQVTEVTTPDSRQDYFKWMVDIRKRVRQVDPNGGRCMILNTYDAVEHCHCVPRVLMKEKHSETVCYRIYYLFWLKYLSS